MCDYYTIDFGKTWNAVTDDRSSKRQNPIGYIETHSVNKYRIKSNYSEIKPGVRVYYTNPSDLEKFDGSDWQIMELPEKHVLHDLHLDLQNRLYVTSSSGTFDEDDIYLGAPSNGPALVYVSRKSMP